MNQYVIRDNGYNVEVYSPDDVLVATLNHVDPLGGLLKIFGDDTQILFSRAQ